MNLVIELTQTFYQAKAIDRSCYPAKKLEFSKATKDGKFSTVNSLLKATLFVGL